MGAKTAFLKFFKWLKTCIYQPWIGKKNILILPIRDGQVFENNSKNNVLSLCFLFFKTKNDTTRFSLVVLIWKRNSRHRYQKQNEAVLKKIKTVPTLYKSKIVYTRGLSKQKCQEPSSHSLKTLLYNFYIFHFEGRGGAVGGKIENSGKEVWS